MVGRKYLASNRRAYLADELGLGKTAEGVCAMADIDARRPMVICPASVIPTWERNVRAWTPHRPMPTILSYDRARILGLDELLRAAPDLLIVDEAHYCAHMSAERTRVVMGLANQTPWVWFLSGTPVRNHAGELYPVLRAVWPDQLRKAGVRDYRQFLDTFTVSVLTRYGPKVIRNRNAEMLRQLLEPVMLRRRLQDVALELPELRWESWYQNIGDDTVAINRVLQGIPGYEALRMSLMHDEFPQDSPHLATLCRQVGVTKAVPAALALAEELDAGLEKVVVMYYHRDVREILRRELERFGMAEIAGGATLEQRRGAEDQFQTDPATRVFLGQITAAGVGITLTAAHEIVMVEQTWSPEDDRQAVKRIHRISQTEPCRARMVTLAGTIDEDIERTRLRKLQMIGEIIHL